VGGGSPYLRTSYEEDAAVVSTPARRAGLAALLVVLAAVPLVAPPLVLDLLCRAAIAVVGAHALNLLTGYTGLVSLGHAGLLAAGAFTAGILAHETGAQVWVTVPAAVTVGAILGLVVGAPSLRLRGVYLALGTLALHFLIIYLVGEYQSGRGLATGLLLPRPALGALRLASPVAWYCVLTSVAGLVTVFTLNLVRTRPGRAWTAIRDREIAAAATGVNVAVYKLLAFVVSSALTAFAGSLWAYYTGFVSVEAFSFFMTIEYIAMIIIGGLGSVLGGVLGAVFVTVFPYGVDAIIDALPVPERFHTYLFAVKFGAFGLLMALFLTLEPRGLVSLWTRIRAWFDLWPFRYHPMAD
jgi:branched-chain amino acid transport system permease protein